MNLGQTHGWQSQGIESLIKTRYRGKDTEFTKAVDFLMTSPLTSKDIRKVAEVAAMVKGMEWPWMLQKETK